MLLWMSYAIPASPTSSSVISGSPPLHSVSIAVKSTVADFFARFLRDFFFWRVASGALASSNGSLGFLVLSIPTSLTSPHPCVTVHRRTHRICCAYWYWPSRIVMPPSWKKQLRSSLISSMKQCPVRGGGRGGRLTVSTNYNPGSFAANASPIGLVSPPSYCDGCNLFFQPHLTIN